MYALIVTYMGFLIQSYVSFWYPKIVRFGSPRKWKKDQVEMISIW